MSVEIARITVPWDVARTCKNQRSRTWHKGARMKAEAYRLALYCYRAAGSPQAEGPVRVSYVVRRGRVMDDDGVISGLAPIRDALFGRTKAGEGITPDDSTRWVTQGEIRQETGKRFVGKETVEVVVESIDAT